MTDAKSTHNHFMTDAKSTPYKIGDIWVILEQVISIATMHKYDANTTYLDLMLNGGKKVVACIEADPEDRVPSNNLSTDGFINKRNKIVEDFTRAWLAVHANVEYTISPPNYKIE